MTKIRVTYWRGTTKCEGTARTYSGALRIASRNQNAYGPHFYDADGNELHDDGNGLAYADRDETLPSGTVRRQYAV